uniref:hypothetical protein n=1 Tax=Escherichia coli TaxID=562 RepID=UPI00215756FA
STPPVFPFIYHCAPYLMGWDVFITFPTETHQNTWHLFPVLLCKGERDSLFAFAREKVSVNGAPY